MRTKVIVPLFAVIFTLIAATFYLRKEGGLCFNSSPYFFEQGYNPDAFEYYLPAANFALDNGFPYYGFVNPISDYHLCAQPDSVAYFRDTQKAGAMVFVSKPPIYSLLVGMAYKIWGLKPCTAWYFNAWCLLLTVALMPLTGFAVARWSGMAAGAMAAITFLLCKDKALGNFDAEILTSCLVMLSLFWGVVCLSQKRPLFYFLFGISMGGLILSKGFFAFTALALAVYLLWQLLQLKRLNAFYALLLYNAGVCALLIPWMLYINPLLQSDIPARQAFYEKFKATTPQIMLATRADGFDSTGKVRPEVLENLNKFHQYQHATENGLVVITNQLGKYNILNVHNEFCTDGDFHPEWRIIKSSFYQHLLNKTNGERLWLFYSQHPKLGMQITLAKLRNIWSISGFAFYASLLMLMLLVCFRKLDNSLVPASLFLGNILFVLIWLYGDMRFVQTVLPVSFLVLFLGAFKLMNRYLPNG